MTDNAITAASLCNNAQDAMDCLEMGGDLQNYYLLNHASPDMKEYLDTCLAHLGGASRERFVRDWLELLKRGK